MEKFASLSPEQFYQQCLAQRRNGYFVGTTLSRDGKHQQLGSMLSGLDALVDYDDHEGVFYQADEASKCLFFAFVHNTNRGQAQGGTRFQNYSDMFELLSDGLRLSKAMSEKCGVADLWWGGGKAIICPLGADISQLSTEQRKVVFSNYGKFIASLQGVYVAAEDMNTTPKDMETILSVNRFVTCLPKAVGGSGNPSFLTAEGVFKAMRATLAFFEARTSLEGCTVSIQGLGNVGTALAKFVIDSGAKKVYVYDINQTRIDHVKSLSNVVEVLTSESQIVSQPCDIFAPCAGGKILNTEVIEMLACKYIVGAANNQLEEPDLHAMQIQDRGIHYLPDFFINRMGIINCANEQYGMVKANLDSALDKVYSDTIALLKVSLAKGISPHFGAMNQATESLMLKHPIWPGQGKNIIQSIMDTAAE